MYYNYREFDPVLQKLSNSTISALHDQDIICVEDLFGLSEKQILDLYGIGKKRADEIMDFLCSLPFDYMDSSLPANPEHNPMLGIHPVLTDHIRNLYHYANDQIFKRGIDYFSQNRVQSITLKDELNETYQAEVRGSQLYSVKFSLQKNQHYKDSCNCPAFKNWLYGSTYCKHIVAAIFALAEQQRLARYIPSDDGNQSYRQMMRSLKSARKEAKLQSTQELSYLLENSNGQWNLYPKPIYGLIKSQKKATRYGYSFSYKNPWDQIKPKSSKDRLIISYLRKMYDRNPNDFGFQGNGNEVNFGDVFELLENETLNHVFTSMRIPGNCCLSFELPTRTTN